jgi:hypothetical protein
LLPGLRLRLAKHHSNENDPDLHRDNSTYCPSFGCALPGQSLITKKPALWEQALNNLKGFY